MNQLEQAGAPAAHASPQQPGGYQGPGSTANAAPAPVQAAALGQFPQQARERKQWLLAGPNDKGEYKVPMSVDPGGNLYHGSSTDMLTWLTFETATAAADHYGYGVGYCLHDADRYTVVDFDVKNANNAPDKPETWTSADAIAHMQAMVEDLDSYTELSQSGQGVHVWVEAKFAGDGLKRKGVEVYCRERFIACTGRSIHAQPLPIADRGGDIAALVASMRGADAAMAAHMALTEVAREEDDEAFLARVRGYSNADKFNALWSGQWQTWIEPGEVRPKYPSQSEADMALMGMLALWSKSNEQCRVLFLRSELGQRDKAASPKGARYLNRMLRKLRGRQAAEVAQHVAKWEESKNIGEGTLPAAPMPVLTLEQMLSELVFIRRKSNVALRNKPASFAPFGDMRNDFAGSKTERKGADGKLKVARTIDDWMESPKKLRADTLTFDPRYGEFCTDPDGHPALNMYRPLHHVAPADWQMRAQPFFDHAAYLVPDAAERERFLNWLAHIEQRPGELPHYGYIMVALKQGVGRNWLAAVLARVWRGHVALDFDLKQTLEKGFNGRLSRKFLGVVDEINEGRQSDQWPHAEKLKSMVTATERYLNPKYGFEYAEHNCCRWLLFSNHLSAIPLNDTDRRWQIIRNPDSPKPSSYYAQLYALLDDPTFVPAVREWMRQRSLSAFNPGEAPTMNEAKRAMVEVARSDAADRATELVRSWPADVITAPEFGRQLYGDDLQRRGAQVKHRALEAQITQWRGPKGGDAARLRVFGEAQAVRVWVLRNAERWAHADSGAIQAELARANSASAVAGVARVLPFAKP